MPSLQSLDVVLIKDPALDAWTAHLVQIDVAAQGSTIQEALQEVQYALACASVIAAKSNSSLEVSVGAAPEEYIERFSQGVALRVDIPAVPAIDPPIETPVPPIREARVV